MVVVVFFFVWISSKKIRQFGSKLSSFAQWDRIPKDRCATAMDAQTVMANFVAKKCEIVVKYEKARKFCFIPFAKSPLLLIKLERENFSATVLFGNCFRIIRNYERKMEPAWKSCFIFFFTSHTKAEYNIFFIVYQKKIEPQSGAVRKTF